MLYFSYMDLKSSGWSFVKDLCFHSPCQPYEKNLLKNGRFIDCQQICRQKGGNQPADFLTVTKSASRNGGGCISVNRFADSQEICHQKYPSPFLPADLLTVGKSASRFADSQEICRRNYTKDLLPARVNILLTL